MQSAEVVSQSSQDLKVAVLIRYQIKNALYHNISAAKIRNF